MEPAGSRQRLRSGTHSGNSPCRRPRSCLLPFPRASRLQTHVRRPWGRAVLWSSPWDWRFAAGLPPPVLTCPGATADMGATPLQPCCVYPLWSVCCCPVVYAYIYTHAVWLPVLSFFCRPALRPALSRPLTRGSSSVLYLRSLCLSGTSSIRFIPGSQEASHGGVVFFLPIAGRLRIHKPLYFLKLPLPRATVKPGPIHVLPAP